MLRSFEARYKSIKAEWENWLVGNANWLPGMDQHTWETTWRGWGNMRWLTCGLGTDREPHSGYHNDKNTRSRFELYFNTPYNRGWMNCGSLEYNDDIWCHGGLKDTSQSTSRGLTHLQWAYDNSSTWNSNTWAHMNLYQRDYYAFQYMLHYSLAERMKMLIDTNYKPTYK